MMRHAQAKGPDAEKAVVESYRTKLKEMNARLARAKHLRHVRCISHEELAVEMLYCRFVQVCEAAVQRRHDLVIEYLQELLNQRQIEDSGETAAYYRDIELEIERARRTIKAGR